MSLDIHLLQKKLGVTDNANAFLILKDLHEGVIIADVHGEVLYYNKAMAKIDDLDMDYALGKKLRSFTNSIQRAPPPCPVSELAKPSKTG